MAASSHPAATVESHRASAPQFAAPVRGPAAHPPPPLPGRSDSDSPALQLPLPSFEPGTHHFAHLAHEMRGPLMALATSAEILSDDLDTLEQWRVAEMLRAIRARAFWLQGLLENVLCATAVQSGRFQLQTHSVNPLDLLDEVQTLLEPVLAQRRQSLRLHPPRGGASLLADVLADGRRIAQVLINFVLNASKYSPKGTPIDVYLSTSGGRLRISVADRGPGLPPGRAAGLFEPFRRGTYDAPDSPGALPRAHQPSQVDQADKADKAAPGAPPPPDGVGLGLAIARAIVHAHAGRIGARNRVGGGAMFWFDLPPAATRKRE